MSTLKYWLWLTTRRGLRTRSALNVLEWFGSPERAFFAEAAEYSQIPGLTDGECKALREKDLGLADSVLGNCQEPGIRIMTWQDASYPERLRSIYEPPLVLYVKGKHIPFDEKVVIGMVGTRKCTPYGEKMGGKLALDMARSGAVIVSGIAEGIDAACIRGALKGGGTVVSVLGGGIDVHYPWVNHDLYEDVAAVGALISEYPPGTRPLGTNFPIRNRIISGLSLGVVVVESDLTGGSMHTVEHVTDQSRDLYAVPGPADAITSLGPNTLIQEGSAKLVMSGWDVLEEYEDRYPAAIFRSKPLSAEAEESRLEHPKPEEKPEKPTPKKPEIAQEEENRIPWSELRDKLTDDQRDILLALEERPCIADELVELTQIPARRVLSSLTILQVGGYVAQEAGKRFRALVKLKME